MWKWCSFVSENNCNDDPEKNRLFVQTRNIYDSSILFFYNRFYYYFFLISFRFFFNLLSSKFLLFDHPFTIQAIVIYFFFLVRFCPKSVAIATKIIFSTFDYIIWAQSQSFDVFPNGKIGLNSLSKTIKIESMWF